MNWLLVTFSLYVLTMVGLGVYFYVNQETKTVEDYLLAGRDVGIWPMAFSQVASVASGWTFFAWVAVGYTVGMGGLWYSLTLPLVTLFVYRYIGPRLRTQSEEYRSLTVVDHLSRFFQDHGRVGDLIRVVGTVSVVLFLSTYVGAQIIAVGDLTTVALDLNYVTGIVVGGIAVALYTALGGFDASIWTDFFQGVLMVVLAFALPIMIILELGGWGSFVSQAAALDSAHLSVTNGLAGVDLLVFVLAYFGLSLSVLGQPHALVRFQAVRLEKLLSPASVVAVAFSTIRMTLPLFIGLGARVLYESVETPSNAAVLAMVEQFPGWIAGLLLAGLASAILPTSDSMMLVTAADVQRFVNRDASERTMVYLSRATVALLGLFGVVVAYYRPGTLFDIIVFAFVGLGASLGLPLAALLLWDGYTPVGILGGIVTGIVATVAN